MQIPVFQFVSASKDDVTEKLLKKLGGFIYVFIKIAVVCTYKRISKIPGIIFKRLVIYIYPKGLQIFDDEYGGRFCVSFRKR